MTFVLEKILCKCPKSFQVSTTWKVLVIALISNFAYSQKPLNPPPVTGPKTKIELIYADSLVGMNQDPITRTWYGNVSFKHKGAVMSCKTAIQNETSNTVEAYGNIKIVQGDTLTITGDTLYYDGNTRFARVLGRKVVLQDKKVVLTTKKVEYDIQKNRAYYPVHGVIVQDSSTLESERGIYNTRSKNFYYRDKVKIVHPKYTITTDSLDYNAKSKLAIFKAPTLIKSKDGDIVAHSGTYNTETRKSNFKGRSKVINEDYTLEGDTIVFDSKTESGIAKGNVEIVSKKDKVILNGNIGIRDGVKGFTKIFGNAIMRNGQEKDTLFLRADSLFAYDDTLQNKQTRKDTAKQVKKIEKMIAKGNVKIFREDLQSKCDSLFYNLKDSSIHFYRKPLLWSRENQLEADTIHVFLKDNKVNRMFLISRSFVIAKDTSSNFNQVKGRKISAYFNKQTRLETVVVEGNGESIYYALDDKNKLIGVNRVECGKMNLKFTENKINRINFIGKPDGKLIPPVELTVGQNQLDGFNWREKEKPTKEEILKREKDELN